MVCGGGVMYCTYFIVKSLIALPFPFFLLTFCAFVKPKQLLNQSFGRRTEMTMIDDY